LGIKNSKSVALCEASYWEIMGCVMCGADVALYIRDVPFCSNCGLEVVEDRKLLPIVEQLSQPEHPAAVVAKKLDAEVESARRRFKRAQKDFEEAIANVSDIASHPDRKHHLRNVGREYHIAAEAFTRAMNHWSKFKTDGTTPNDLTE
jgi:hypothetical protein